MCPYSPANVAACCANGTHVPVEEPSTASIADIAPLIRSPRAVSLPPPKVTTRHLAQSGQSNCVRALKQKFSFRFVTGHGWHLRTDRIANRLRRTRCRRVQGCYDTNRCNCAYKNLQTPIFRINFMIRPLLFGIAILIAGATQATAQGLPSFKIEQGCREVSSGQNKLTTFDECMEDEKSARDDLTKSWETFVASDRRVCLEETTSDGTLSYVELLECLNIVRDTNEVADCVDAHN